MKYGLYDTKDQCWIGNKDGPLSYDEQFVAPNGVTGDGLEIAKYAAQVVCERMGWNPTRVRATPIDCAEPVLKDSIAPNRTSEEAITRLERGA